MEELIKKLNELNNNFIQKVELLRDNPELLKVEYDDFNNKSDEIIQEMSDLEKGLDLE